MRTLIILVVGLLAVGCGKTDTERLEEENRRLKAELENKRLKAAKELIPDIVTTSTKKGITHGFALLYPEAEVRADLERGAAEAISNAGDINPLAMSGPIEVKIKMGGGRETIKADVCAMFPWVERLSGTSIDRVLNKTHGILSKIFI